MGNYLATQARFQAEIPGHLIIEAYSPPVVASCLRHSRKPAATRENRLGFLNGVLPLQQLLIGIGVAPDTAPLPGDPTRTRFVTVSAGDSIGSDRCNS